MTVAITDNLKSYTCTGASNDYPTTFPFYEESELYVYRETTAGVKTLLTLTTDYSVAGGSGSTGTVTTVSTYSDGKLHIQRLLPTTQAVDLINNDGFSEEIIEGALDKLTMIDQQQDEEIDRCVKVPVGSTASAELPEAEAGKGIAWDSTGETLENVSLGLDSGVSASSFPTQGYAAMWDGMGVIDSRVYGATGDGADETIAIESAIAATTKPIMFSLTHSITLTDINAQTIMKEINRFVVPGSLTINIASGVCNFSDFIDITNRYAQNIEIVGSDTVDATILTIGSVTGSTGAWSVPITVDDASEMAVGRYVNILP